MNIVALVFAATILCVSSQNVYQGMPAGYAFTAQYQKFNPNLQGSGLTTGTITYDGADAAFQLVNNYFGRTTTELYTFNQAPSSLTTQCTPSVYNQAGDAQYWLNPAAFQSIASGGSSGSCATPPGPCTVGSQIQASVSGNTITYTLSRYDQGGCGCAVQYICYPLPTCQPCSGVTVSGGQLLCGSAVPATVNCSGTGTPALITLNAGVTTFSVTMTGASVGYGPIGLMNTNNANTAVTCPTAAFTCIRSGFGTGKYKQNSCGALGNECELSSTSDMMYWPLWYNNGYYSAGVADPAVTGPGGAACLRYARSGAAPPSSPPTMDYVLNLWLTTSNPPVVCGWNTSNGDMYSVTSYSTGGNVNPAPPSGCNSDLCWKPLDLAFIIEITDKTTFQDMINYQNFFNTLTNYVHISPQEVNLAFIMANPKTGAYVDTALITNQPQLYSAVRGTGKFSCCVAFTTLDAQCCPGYVEPANLLPDAIVLAANTLAAFPTRTYVSKNIITMTQGTVATAGSIGSALATGSTAIKNKAQSTIPYASAILNYNTYYFGTDQAQNSIYDAVRTANDNRNAGLATTTQLSTLGLASQFDTVQNRAWSRPSTYNIDDGLRSIIADLCASNNQRACGSCCGDCSCGAICAAPTACKKLICYNVSLTPFPIQSNTCCNYTIYQCPGYNAADLCNSVSCNFTNDQCTTNSIKCPAATTCYNYTCNPASGTCDPIPRFSNPNPCYTAGCPSGNSIVYTPKTCAALACKTYKCDNSTGNCLYTDINQTFTAATCCMTATCNTAGNGWVYDFPAACKPGATSCFTAQCDTSCQCVQVPKCVSTTCTNITCTSSGTCNTQSCPPTKVYPNGTVDNCQIFQGPCTNKLVFDSVFSSCVYNQRTCPVSDPVCQIGQCNTANGQCSTTNLCPAYQGGTDRCHPLVAGGCATLANGTVTCQYRALDTCDVQYPTQSDCNDYTCNPANGVCTVTPKCTAFDNATGTLNRCRPWDQTQCSPTNFQCVFINRAPCAALSDPCYNNTCQPAIGCPTTLSQTTYWNGCTPQQAGNLCQVRFDPSCRAVANGTAASCTYNPRNCTSPDPCLNSTCLTTGLCSTPTTWPNCSFFLNGNNFCFTRINTSCVGQGNCQYNVSRNCVATNFWQRSTCAIRPNNSTFCNVTDICPQFENGNRCRNISQVLVDGTCVYADVVCVASSNQCIQSLCDPTVGCVQRPFCANTSKCNVSSTCNGNCNYGPYQCPPPPDACSHYVCDPTTSTVGCDLNVTCPPFYQINSNTVARCLAQTSCTPCTYAVVNCQQPTDTCQIVTCANNTGCGQPVTWCQLYNTTGGVQDKCTIRGNCSQGCSYTRNTCASSQPADPCQVANCIPSSGGCQVSQVCPVFGNGGNDKCYPRNNQTCDRTNPGACQYTQRSCASFLTTLQPCQTAVCNPATGNCDIVANPNFTTANCPPSTDPCLVVDISGARNGSCCGYIAKCPQGANLCNVSACVNGTCRYTSTSCPSTNPLGNLCDVSTGCNSASGQCTFGRKVCPQNASYGPCYSGTCNNDTGVCEYAVNPNLCGICDQPGVTLCPPRNCTAYECRPLSARNYTCDPVGTVCDVTYGGNTCVNGTCDPRFNTCPGVGITVADCYRVYGPPDLCFYWATNPLFTGCCQQLPVCNSQVDFNYKCMLKICNASTNGACELFDNTQNVCPTYRDNDLCQPFQACNNATGTCTYDNIGIGCAMNETRPCYQGLCNASTGQCYSSLLPGCNATAICARIAQRCPVDACEIQLCNTSDPQGSCMVNFTRVCPPVDNCTNQRCDRTLGCVPVPYNLGLCNKTVPANAPQNFSKIECIRVFANGTKSGCCDSELMCPLAPANGDPICNPLITCTDSNPPGNATCLYRTPQEICPFQYLTDPITGAQDLCRPYAGCSYGCIYTAPNCSVGNITCQISQCNPQTGLCETTDLCQNDGCVKSHCDTTTGKCVVDYATQCRNDGCITQECVWSGCVTLNYTSASNCQARIGDPCQTGYTNGSNPTCCNYRPKCIPTNACSNATCNGGVCTFTGFCAQKKCEDAICLLDASGNPTCTYSPKPCDPANKCELVDQCVEDGQPYSCIKRSFCNASNDTCWAIECDPSGSFPRCLNYSDKNCDDNNACTLDLCYENQCHYQTCPYTDLCKPQVCQFSQCTIKDVPCNDYNECTLDTCVNGTCVHTAVNCDDLDNCTDDSCDVTKGCLHPQHTCLKTEACWFEEGGNAPVLRDPCFNVIDNRTDPVCDEHRCYNQTCHYKVIACYSPITQIAVAAAIGTGVLIGIIIGCVICCALAGGGAYAVYSKNPFDKEASVMNNPLYHGGKNEIQNPLHRQN